MVSFACSAPFAALLLMELLERLAYYASVFTFTTFSVSMLGYSVKESNALLQGLWAISPIAALGASALADEKWGRPKTIAFFGFFYVVALIFIALAASPIGAFYGTFPTEPTPAAQGLFLLGVIVLGVGYGGMKSSLSPLIADTAFLQEHPQVQIAQTIEPGDATAHDDPTSQEGNPILLSTAGTTNGGGSTFDAPPVVKSPTSTLLSTPQPDDGEKEVTAAVAFGTESERAAVSSMFRWYYWVFNIGALIGGTIGPLLLPLESRKLPKESNTNGETASGYYYTYWLSAGVTALGMIIFAMFYRRYVNVLTSGGEFRAMWRLCIASLKHLWRRRFGGWFNHTCTAPETSEKCANDDDASIPQKATTSVGDDKDQPWLRNGTFTASVIREDDCPEKKAKETLGVISRVLLVFSALPIYWLCCTQYGSNLMLQASWMELPSNFEPELFGNVNTFAMLLFLPLLDRVLVPAVMKGKRPSAVKRMVVGFILTVIGLVWIGALQLVIEQRGRLDGKNYHLHSGATQLSAAWLLGPYILQGMASALVDTTAIETAYLLAPVNMKSFVHALYLLCSSASGWIGLLIAPLIGPHAFMISFFCFALVLAVCTVVFDRFASPVEQKSLQLLNEKGQKESPASQIP